MRERRRIVIAAMAAASIGLSAGAGFAAERSPQAPSQAEIERLLKTRGIPTPGNALPAPPAGPGSAYTPANLPTPPAGAAGEPAQSAAQPMVALPTIRFEFASARLTPDSIETLRNLGNALNQGLKDEKSFSIEGHTDRTGGRAYNDELSRRRADAVKAFLVNEMAVAPQRLRTVGKGFSEPANPRDPYGAENRRVVVVNLAPSS